VRYRIPPRTRVISGSSEYVAVLVSTGIDCCRSPTSPARPSPLGTDTERH
jgi:hypothetical protein